MLPEEAQAVLKELYADNGGCQLPCWWGITPGETTWAQANQKLAPMGMVSSPSVGHEIFMYEITFRIPEGIEFPTKTSEEGNYYTYYFGPNIYVKGESVLAISLNTGWISQEFDYSLAGLLNMLGQPEEIWVSLITDVVPEYGPRYDIRLFYPTTGILLSSIGSANRRGDALEICPREFRIGNFPAAITLWSATLEIAFQDINVSLWGGMASMDSSQYYLLEDLTEGFDITDFYETYLDPATPTCFEVTPP